MFPCTVGAPLYPGADVTRPYLRAVWPDLLEGPLWGQLTALAWMPAEKGLYTLLPSPAHLSSTTALRCVDMLPFFRWFPQQAPGAGAGLPRGAAPVLAPCRPELEQGCHAQILTGQCRNVHISASPVLINKPARCYSGSRYSQNWSVSLSRFNSEHMHAQFLHPIPTASCCLSRFRVEGMFNQML